MAKQFKKLTRDALRQLTPGQSVTEYGITFQRVANGDGVYSVNVMVDGIRVHRVIGRESEGVTRTQAETFIEKAKTDARHDRLALPKGRKLALSFRDAAGKYLKRLGETGGKNIAIKKRHLETLLVPAFGDRPLSKLVRLDIERYCRSRLDTVAQIGGDHRSKTKKPKQDGDTVKPGTVNRELATLSHMLNQAVEWGWMTHAPKVKLLKEGDGRIVYLSTDQVRRFMTACLESDSPHLYAFVRVALATSMRRSEVFSIRKEHIDTAKRVIYVPKAKAGAREQPITKDLAEFLDRYLVESVPQESEWLFPSPRSASGHVVAIEKPWREAVLAAGLDVTQVVRHTMRHTAISHMVQAGVDLPTVQRVSGHKTLQMVVKYSHQNGAHIDAAMDKLEARLGESAGRVA